MEKTQREYSDIETGIIYGLYKDNADRFHLIIDKPQGSEAPTIGTEVNGFYMCAFTDCVIKLNTGKKVSLNNGSFYNIKNGEEITHKKFAGFNKFTKV